MRVAKLLDVVKGTMSRFWREIQMRMESGNQTINEVMQDVGFIKSMKENCGSRLKYDRKALKENLILIPLKTETELQSVVCCPWGPEDYSCMDGK